MKTGQDGIPSASLSSFLFLSCYLRSIILGSGFGPDSLWRRPHAVVGLMVLNKRAVSHFNHKRINSSYYESTTAKRMKEVVSNYNCESFEDHRLCFLSVEHFLGENRSKTRHHVTFSFTRTRDRCSRFWNIVSCWFWSYWIEFCCPLMHNHQAFQVSSSLIFANPQILIWH